MDDDLRYRSELADQFIERLRAVSPSQWRELVTHHRGNDNYYALAVELADEATRLLGDDRRAAYESALTQRLARTDEIVDAIILADVGALDEIGAHDARRLARAAVHAMLVRDAYGFNAGAFGELIRPFRAYLDLGDVERSASRVRTPPSGAPPQPPEASA
ncbi:MAG: hypothetical protein IPF87_22105 [Gemmatimonadetes bacterium]|nr:hypothetical protein [Gemmatimonadota bacterium]MBK6843712.1 hypothetical protein [Gemmatimonadota bacterium]